MGHKPPFNDDTDPQVERNRQEDERKTVADALAKAAERIAKQAEKGK